MIYAVSIRLKIICIHILSSPFLRLQGHNAPDEQRAASDSIRLMCRPSTRHQILFTRAAHPGRCARRQTGTSSYSEVSVYLHQMHGSCKVLRWQHVPIDLAACGHFRNISSRELLDVTYNIGTTIYQASIFFFQYFMPILMLFPLGRSNYRNGHAGVASGV
jgi:hypothetical protein